MRPARLAGTYHQLGRVAEERRDFDAAEAWYRKALAVFERLGDGHGAGIARRSLARAGEGKRRGAQGQYVGAVEGEISAISKVWRWSRQTLNKLRRSSRAE